MAPKPKKRATPKPKESPELKATRNLLKAIHHLTDAIQEQRGDIAELRVMMEEFINYGDIR
jgi:hypothetical protein